VHDAVRYTDVNVEALADTGQIPQEISADFRRNFSTHYPGRNYGEYEAAYEAGYQAAAKPEYPSLRFEQVEEQLKSEFSRARPQGDWQQVRNAVRYGWDRRTR